MIKMRIFTIFSILSLVSLYCHCLKVPNKLKCVDKNCELLISTGRVSKTTEVINGDLTEIKPGKVDILGKSDDPHNFVWLIRKDNVKLFVDANNIKENSANIRSDLEVVINPIIPKDDTELLDVDNKLTPKEKYDETEVKEEDSLVKQRIYPNIDPHTQLPNSKLEIPTTQHTNNLNNEEKIKVADNKINKDQIKLQNDKPIVDQVNENSLPKTQFEASSIPPNKEIKLKTEDVNNLAKVPEKPSLNVNKGNESPSSDKIESKKEGSNNPVEIPGKSSLTSKSDNNLNKNIESRHPPPIPPVESKIEDINNTVEISGEPSLTVKSNEDSNVELNNQINHSIKDNINNKIDKNLKLTPENNLVTNSNENVKLNNKIEPIEPQKNFSGETNVKENVPRFKLNMPKNVKEDTENGELTNLNSKTIEKKDDNKILETEDDVKNSKDVSKKKDNVNVVNTLGEENKSKIAENVEIPIKIEGNEEINSENHEKLLDETRMTKDSNVQSKKNNKDSKSINKNDTEESKLNNYSKQMLSKDSLSDNESIIKKHELSSKDPWIESTCKSSEESYFKSPFLRLLMKLDILSRHFMKSILDKMNINNTVLAVFIENWFQLPFETFLMLVSLIFVLFFVNVTPKLFGFRRDLVKELETQIKITKEMEWKLKSAEEARSKLANQNHTFEKVNEDYKAKMSTIKEDAKINWDKLVGDLEKVKKGAEIKLKKQSDEMEQVIKQCQMLELGIRDRDNTIETLQEQLKQTNKRFNEDRDNLNASLDKLQKELTKSNEFNGDLKKKLETKIHEFESSVQKVSDLEQQLMNKDVEYQKLEQSFKKLEVLEGLNDEECQSRVEDALKNTELKALVEQLNDELSETKTKLMETQNQLEQQEITAERAEQNRRDMEVEKNDAVKLQYDAEMSLKVLREYFQSREMEIQKSLGHQEVVKSNSAEMAEAMRQERDKFENEINRKDVLIDSLKQELSVAKNNIRNMKHKQNEYFVDNQRLDREIMAAVNDNKMLRARLSSFVGPIQQPPPVALGLSNQQLNSTNNPQHPHRPSSRHSGGSEHNSTSSHPQIFSPSSKMMMMPTQSTASFNNSPSAVFPLFDYNKIGKKTAPSPASNQMPSAQSQQLNSSHFAHNYTNPNSMPPTSNSGRNSAFSKKS